MGGAWATGLVPHTASGVTIVTGSQRASPIHDPPSHPHQTLTLGRTWMRQRLQNDDDLPVEA